ncbi:hypothetical protein ACN27F_20405 [Solwaraspora sp. WMMB335]|uniref:hypothetical protein n=1 Tax=Solwaraspora sp. WMMB335 TaxID=3404118 RepID=UPI003B954DF2
MRRIAPSPVTGRTWPPLPKRTPAKADVDNDPRFRLMGARAVVPAPRRAGGPGGRGFTPDPEADQVLRYAREVAEKHLPIRTGECPACGVVAFCAPFTMALAVLDRRDVPRARRIRTVLTVAGLRPPEFPHPADGDEGSDGNGNGSGDGDNDGDGWCDIVC